MTNQARENDTEDDGVLKPYHKTINGYFVREGEEFAYPMFDDPWFDHERRRQPRIEIFGNLSIKVKDELSSIVESREIQSTNTVETRANSDVEDGLFQMFEGDEIFTINDVGSKEDLTKLIMPASSH